MIQFFTTEWSWDLTNYGLTFNEASTFFTDTLTKNYSFPISVEINEDIGYKLGLVHLSGIRDYKTKIYGTLTIDNNFYEAYIFINQVKGNKAEITFFYGKETLSVFDKQLKNLPFKVTATPENSLSSFARDNLQDTWPNTSHQFVSMYRNDISSLTNYENFKGWVNLMEYSEVGGVWVYTQNVYFSTDDEVIALNHNVMCPMTYLLEILKVGFSTEGLDIRGDMVNDEFFKKLLIVPQNFMEHYAVTEYLNYSFSVYESQEQLNGNTINVYSQTHTPTVEGSYLLRLKINMSDTMAQYFYIKVTKGANTIYEVETVDQQVILNHTLNINVSEEQINQDIVVTMKLIQQPGDITPYNNFTYEFKEGQVNVFPNVYSIADYMPNITFRTFFNYVKNWLNLDVVYTENSVYLNFVENVIDDFIYTNREHLEAPEPQRELNQNNLFELSYPNEETLKVNRNGQTFSDTDITDAEKTNLDFKVLPLTVEDNFGKVTATYPETVSDLMVILYDGTTDGENLATDTVNGRTLSLQDVYQLFWKKWLNFRTNSETVKDSFKMHYTEAINLRDGEFKYNTKRLIVSLRKKRESAEYYNVELVCETF